MKKVIFFLLIFTTVSCSKEYCSLINENKLLFQKLKKIIEENPSEFYNNSSIPRVYYTYNYQKEFSDFQKTTSSKNINQNEYQSLKNIFKNLSINEIRIYDSKNLLFKVGNKDIFLSNFIIYIGYLEEKSIEKVEKNFDVIESKQCNNGWYYFLARTSIAN